MAAGRARWHFRPGLYHQRRNECFVGIQVFGYINTAGKRLVEAKLLHLQVGLQVIGILLQRYKGFFE